jgi:uncharacterized membrane protein
VANERRLVDETDALRHRHDLERRGVWALYLIYPALIVLILVLAFWRNRVKDVPKYLQEPPADTHPVELAYLWAAYRGHFSPSNAYRAQLLHLARTGVIEVSAVGRVSTPEDLTIRWKDWPQNELDQDFLEFLFGADGKEPVSLRDIKATGNRRTRLLEWTKDATDKTKDVVTRIRKGKSRAESYAVLTVSGLTAFLGYYFANDVAGDHVGYGLIPLAVVGWLVAGRIMPPRPSANMRKRIAKWKAFRRFLKNFSSLPDAPAMAVVIWEKYLVYAVALGVAKQVQKQVTALVAEEDLPPAWPGGPVGLQGYWLSQHMSSAPVAHAVASAASSSGWSSGWGSSSSSGGFSGGGFSGGGGGGGGGSGGGAG